MKTTLRLLLFFITIFIPGVIFAQLQHDAKEPVFTRADTLRGMLTPLRTCYDVKYYNLYVRIDTSDHSIKGSNVIYFKAVNDFNKMQVDLFPNMKIDRIEFEKYDSLKYTREFGAVFISFPEKLLKDKYYRIKIYYHGVPQEAKNPPWDGGFVWAEDNNGNPWIAVACQGTGASLWWPNKDHQSDEPDSMLINISVPASLEEVSNGRLRSTEPETGDYKKYTWFVSYPINNYDVTFNIAKYAHFSDFHIEPDGDTLTLDYYVLPYNLEKAKKQFVQAKSMLNCFEKYFGSYPFVRDGYKLVETPYLGMEHQSAVAYGNKYLNGYLGNSAAEIGMKFDFIIIHESAHEWWGNSITSKDIADMWIHESFGQYCEALYVECMYGRLDALDYINAHKSRVMNNRPIIGHYNVNNEGSGDMYPKGMLMLNTLRSVIDNDGEWFKLIKDLYQHFKYQTVTAEDIVDFVNKETGRDFTYFFDQYLRYPHLPKLELKSEHKDGKEEVAYRWHADVKNFNMPIKVTTSPGEFEFIYPSESWKTLTLEGMTADQFKVAEDLFYVDVEWLDERHNIAFGFSDGSGKNILTYSDYLSNPQKFDKTISDEYELINLIFYKKKESTNKNTGRYETGNFNNLAGYQYRAFFGKVDTAKSAILLTDYFLKNKQLLPFKDSLIAVDNKENLNKMEKDRNRKIMKAWKICEGRDGSKIYLVDFVGNQKSEMLSLVLGDGNKYYYKDYSSSETDKNKLRSDDGGPIDPRLFSVAALFKEKNGYGFVFERRGAEGTLIQYLNNGGGKLSVVRESYLYTLP